MPKLEQRGLCGGFVFTVWPRLSDTISTDGYFSDHLLALAELRQVSIVVCWLFYSPKRFVFTIIKIRGIL